MLGGVIKRILENQDSYFQDYEEDLCGRNLNMAKIVALAVMVVLVTFEAISICIYDKLDLKLSYVLPCFGFVLMWQAGEWSYRRKKSTTFLIRYLPMLMQSALLAFDIWLDIVADAALYEIYTPLILIAGPILFFQPLKVEFFINTSAYAVYILLINIVKETASRDHAFFQTTVAYMVSLVVMVFVLDLRIKEVNAIAKLRREQAYREIIEALGRDFVNVFQVDLKKNIAKVIKLEGYVTTGLDKENSDASYFYYDICKTYIKERVHPEDAKKMLGRMSPEHVKEQLKSSDVYTEIYRILVDGEVHYYRFKYIKLHGTEHIIVGFQSIDDVIERERQQREELEAAWEQAKAANHAKTAFLNSMSHDIRTPMNAIIGFTALAKKHIDNKEQTEQYLNKITMSSNHLLSLINDVLDMSRIESGHVQIVEKECSLALLAHEVQNILQADIKKRRLNYVVHISHVENEYVYCDKLRINQVLLNIISNAVKYTNPGGSINIYLSQKQNDKEGWGTYTLRVKDTGIGMSRQFLDHIFEPFTREETSTVSGIQGTGLGLAITKNIIDMMNGTIEIESEVDVGTEVTVQFDFRIAKNPDPIEEIKELKGQGAVVVTRDKEMSENLAGILQKMGLCTFGENFSLGREAIHFVSAQKKKGKSIRIFFVDEVLEDMSGIELVRQLKTQKQEENFIVILAVESIADMNEEAKKAGVTDFCEKPVFFSDLYRALKKHVGQTTRESFEEKEADFNGVCLLLVEDNELNREIAEEILQEEGFLVDTATDGQIAVDKVKQSQPGCYKMILMDIQMPVMDGYEATKAIRSLERKDTKTIPIIALSANAFSEDGKKALDVGMNEYVTKPFKTEELNEILSKYL